MEKWYGKFAVVTGASSGVGAVVTEKLARNGINVIGLARRSEVIEENIKKLGELSGKIYARKCDLTNLQSIKDAFKWIEDTFGTINIFLNNAGISVVNNMLEEGDEAENFVNHMISTNFIGVVHCTRKAVELMKKSDDPSIIVNINSTLGHQIPFMPVSLGVYPATKFGVRAFSECARQELLHSDNANIRITSISPGLIKTPMTAGGFFDQFPMLQPGDIAETLMYILSTPTSVNIQDIIMKPNGAVH
ncbi:farnesol dehydrogenase-like [Chironomus tepperi]|uniref:farnesol dehydrogenase-like n=1 Tax=Chironomus tepperi TaxID=113505 RepID=UPI00391F9C5F